MLQNTCIINSYHAVSASVSFLRPGADIIVFLTKAVDILCDNNMALFGFWGRFAAC